MTKLLRHIILLIFALQTLNFCGQVKLNDEFHLVYKNKTRTIRSKKDVRIYTDWVRDGTKMKVQIYSQSDSTFTVTSDTFAVRPGSIFYLEYKYSEAYRSESPHYPLKSTFVIKLPISAIEKITVARDAVQYSTTIIGYLALTSAVLVAPIVSINKPFNKERYKNIAGYSLITAVSALTINLTFGHKKYYLKKHKNKKIWTLN
jgi:hypothetical protein